MDVYQPGIIERKLPKLKEILVKIEENEQYIRAMSLLALIFTMIEISKDYILVGTILQMIGGFKAPFLFPTKFTSTIVFCLFVTLVVPLIFSTLGLALDDPEVILKPYKISNRFNRFTIEV